MWNPQKLGLGASVVAIALVTTLSGGAATAKTAHVTDGRDSPAAVDITSVTYRNQETRAGATVHVRDLRRTGKLVTLIGLPDSDSIYYVTVWVRSDGTLGKRLELVSDMSRTRRPCAISATWSPGTNSIRVSVPHSCLRFGRFPTRHWLRTGLTVGAAHDAARGIDVGRGSSPGCATAAEVKSLRRGDSKARVHAILDTAGRFGDRAAGGYSRLYRSCSGGKPWFVEYRGTTDTLVATGRAPCCRNRPRSFDALVTAT